MKHQEQTLGSVDLGRLLVFLGCLMVTGLAGAQGARDEVQVKPNGRVTVAANNIPVQALCAQFGQQLGVEMTIGVDPAERATVDVRDVSVPQALHAVAKDVRIVYAVDRETQALIIERIGCFSEGHPDAQAFGGGPNSVGFTVDPKALADVGSGPGQPANPGRP